VTGDLDTHDGICRVLAAAGSFRVVSIDYRLAPEHPFPAALDDALAATDWVAAHANEVGIDPARLGIGGDSAGAGLAARVCQERRGGAIRAQLLICPVLDVHGARASRRDFARGYLLDEATIQGDLAACGPRPPRPRPGSRPCGRRTSPACRRPASTRRNSTPSATRARPMPSASSGRASGPRIRAMAA
jgi:acetyl esterase/lipase